ncbi:MAG TPA: hypothetical protein PL161_13195 [Spirochaetota bacterium]|nr:hypothetical protein [Spirochaetota bacterium]
MLKHKIEERLLEIERFYADYENDNISNDQLLNEAIVLIGKYGEMLTKLKERINKGE